MADADKDQLTNQLVQQQQLLTQLIQLQQQQLAAMQNESRGGATPVAIHQPAVPPPGVFSFQAEDWEEWKSRFERYRRTALAGYTTDQQVDYLIGHLGQNAEKILKSFHLSDQDVNKYDTVIAKFYSYFSQKKNLVYERVKFLQRVQKPEEPCDTFITDLTTMAQMCEWGDLETEMIKLRIIAGLADSKLSVQLQSRPDDNMDEIIRRVRLAETLRKQQMVVRASVPAPSSAPSTDVQQPIEVSAVRGGAHKKYFRQNKYKNNESTKNSGASELSECKNNQNSGTGRAEKKTVENVVYPRDMFLKIVQRKKTRVKSAEK